MIINNIDTHIGNSCIPKDYGYLNKRDYDKIDIYVNGAYVGSTTWAANCTIARKVYADKHRVPLYIVKAHRS